MSALILTERLVELTTGLMEISQQMQLISPLLQKCQAENRDPTPEEWAQLDMDLASAKSAAHSG